MKVKGLDFPAGFCFLLLLFTPFLYFTANAQAPGDYRSNAASMHWNNAADWQEFDGINWNIAVRKPGSTTNVFLQNGHTVILTGNETCHDLHISTGITTASDGTDAQLALHSFSLSVNGKLRSYAAPVGTVPGTSVLVNGEPITITPGSAGKIRFTGNTRFITEIGEWSANNVANAATFAIEINLNPGETASLGTVFKASSWAIISGTLDAGPNRIAVDNGTAEEGDVYIAPGATFISAKTGTGSNAVLSRGATTSGGNLIVDGTLVLTGLSPSVGMKTIRFNGTVDFARLGNQTLVAGINGGEVPLVYHHLKLSGTGTKRTLPEVTTLLAENGTLEISGEATPAVFALGTNSSFDVTNAGTRLIYNAPVLQTTGAEWNTGFSDIIIDNLAGLTLNAARRVENKLTLVKGTVNTTATRILTIGENGAVAGGSDRSYINGPLIRVSASVATSQLAFPIGKGSVYKPVILAVAHSSAIATNYTAELFNTAPTVRNLPANDLDKVSSIRYFKLTKGSGGSPLSQASVTIFYGPDDAVTDAENLRIVRSSASNWINVGGTGEPMVNGSGSITSDVNFTTLGDFVLANAKGGANILPVTLVYFEGSSRGSKVHLKWQTSCETNSDRFEIEKSTDGIVFAKIGTVKAAGTSSELKNYSFEDKNPGGENYYRLKQIDIDGSFVYFKIITVKNTTHKSTVSVYPNPASDNIYIEAATVGNLLIEISNAAGQVVLSENIPDRLLHARHPVSVRHLPAGVYQVVLTGNAGRQSVKLIKE